MRMTPTRTVARPAEEVFEFFADASNNPKWQHGMKECSWTTDPPLRVGSRYEQRARLMGWNVISVFEVTEFKPGQLIRIETIKSTFPIQVTRTVSPIDETSCEVSAIIDGGPESGLMKWMEPLIGRRAQQSVDADYDRLVQLLGASTASTE